MNRWVMSSNGEPWLPVKVTKSSKYYIDYTYFLVLLRWMIKDADKVWRTIW